MAITLAEVWQGMAELVARAERAEAEVKRLTELLKKAEVDLTRANEELNRKVVD